MASDRDQTQEWLADFASAVPGIQLDVGVASASLCTWRVGGPLAVVARVASVAELVAVARATPANVPVLVIGRGSNLLVSDSGFAGIAVVLGGDFVSIGTEAVASRSDVGVEDAQIVVAGGAVALPQLARRAAALGLGGLEFFVGIPGSVGGAVRMNAGGHGRETCEVLLDATVVDLATAVVVTRVSSELDFGYRHSNIAETHVVTSARFLATPGDIDKCETALDEIVRWRRVHQPGGANAGSVFANPPGRSAGQLIDECGLKGFRIGGAFVSPKHANFIQTEPTATATDVIDVIRHVRATVLAHRNCALRTEVRLVGHPPNIIKELQT